MKTELTRRTLFGCLAAALAADPERLLWVPGKRLWTFPRRSSFYASFWKKGLEIEAGDVLKFNSVLMGRQIGMPNLEVLAVSEQKPHHETADLLVLLSPTRASGRIETCTSFNSMKELLAYNERNNPLPSRRSLL